MPAAIKDVCIPRALAALIFLICAPNFALAWGELGHRTVAEIATHYLSEQTTAEVHKLLGNSAHAMAEVSVWADAIRDGDRPETYYWHVVEIPANGVRYDRARDCKNDDCIVEKIKEFARVLGDRTVDWPLRVEALQFLIHFVGDLHMPLHAFAPLNHPKGTWIKIGETVDKLHLWWDNEFVDELGFDSSNLANTLAVQITADDRKKWEMGTSEDWANESFKISSEFISKHKIIVALRENNNSDKTPIVLPVSVIDEVKPIVAQRLKMAGVRLAWLLNQAFK
ncbi:MAG: S1/P1 nuclease [Rhizobiales bacterium]|nr:S1/P1 nuclease [Hyphomicrobiales bacterium]